MSERFWFTWHPSTWRLFWGRELSLGWVTAIQIGPFNYVRGFDVTRGREGKKSA